MASASHPTSARSTRSLSSEDTEVGPGTGEIEDVDAKTLVIRGEDDLVVTRELSRRVTREIDDARLVELAECGHAPTVDAPEELLDAVEPFIDVPV